MKRFVPVLFVLLVGVANLQGQYINEGQGNCKSRVLPDFNYPESMGTVEIVKPFVVNSLSGKVVAPNGEPLEKVLVEIVTSGSEERIDATFTDVNGFFGFDRALKPRKETILRFNLPGFITLIVKVVINKKSKKLLVLELPLSA